MNYSVKQIIWVSIFALAMGLLEAAVVVYLRELYYPETTSLFPMRNMLDLAGVELSREFATIVMLAGIGIVAGKNKWSRWGYFILSFGIWDIFYYVFLKVFIQWPDTLLDWDILFLIPLPWFGPVLAPVLIALLMTFWGMYMGSRENKGRALAIRRKETALLLPGLAIMLFTFLWDSLKLVFERAVSFTDFSNIGALAGFKPDTFLWWLFLIGFMLSALSFGLYIKRVEACSTPSH